jgi:hypothetical protein
MQCDDVQFLQVSTSVSEGPASAGNGTFLCNIGTRLPNYMVSHYSRIHVLHHYVCLLPFSLNSGFLLSVIVTVVVYVMAKPM